MSHNTHEGIRNLSPVFSISLALLFFYFYNNYLFLFHNLGFRMKNKYIDNDSLPRDFK